MTELQDHNAVKNANDTCYSDISVCLGKSDLGSLGEIATRGRVEMGRKKVRMITLVGWLALLLDESMRRASCIISTSPRPSLLHHTEGKVQWPSVLMVASSQTNFNGRKALSCVSADFLGVEKKIYVRVNKMAALHSNAGQDYS